MQQKEEKIAGHTAKHIAGHTAEHTAERNAEHNDEITTSLQENAARFQKIFSGCADIKNANHEDWTEAADCVYGSIHRGNRWWSNF